jgi:hypothetical protein
MSNLYRVLSKVLEPIEDVMDIHGVKLFGVSDAEPNFIATHDFSIYENKSDEEIKSLLLKLNISQLRELRSVFRDTES